MNMRSLKIAHRLGSTAAIALLLSAGTSAPAQAGIETIKRMCIEEKGLRECSVSRPSFKPPEGWTVDREVGANRGIEVYLPAGKRFGDAPVLIFGEARPNPGRTPLAEWVANSDRKWIAMQRDAKVVDLPSDGLGAGKREVLVHRYENPAMKNQPIEVIAYFAEDDAAGNSFVIRLTLSGLRAKAIEEARGVFDSVLHSY